jgi:hypothetical protein
MDLERRVEALEKELQVLKGQIQATLLDIQEQILTNAYPTLRAENAAPEPERHATSAPNPITILAANPADTARPGPREDEEDEASPVNVRKVSLNDFEDDAPDEPPAKSRKRGAAPAQPKPDLDLTTLSRLEEWATEKLEHMGVARTKQLIRMYAEQGRFTPDVEATLLNFVSIYEETTVPLATPGSRKRPARPAAPSNNAKASRRAAPQDEPEPAPRKKASASNADNPAMKTIPAEPTPRKQGPSEPPAARAVNTPNQAPPDQASSPNGAPGGDDDDDQASVVLKLIAGIHNAGAGVQWRKKDG